MNQGELAGLAYTLDGGWSTVWSILKRVVEGAALAHAAGPVSGTVRGPARSRPSRETPSARRG